ncbi:peptide chain release factor N(5)-glutamine methyltransferase [Aliiroseovarius subalbicans]|uniref:peptide chain release factor N(5)-glutamine methyltransferase n=1 Tax=Aliiroseovarius subalbicans TaxID=2925840 RepID=UPI001F56FFEC|nr:peptide chain release factor N(5)-glutamine methyltransferase [Aliiroseovarius subalbicans]MCI2398476.1 peptide chain release factor N(5)-glutamine methyltransferase [Aliiroseovarius subalbicans]
MTGSEALAQAVRDLRGAGVDDPARDARRLLAMAMGIDPGRLTLHLHDALGPGEEARFREHIQARLTRQPVAQIVGYRDFYGRRFIVTPAVLDPRPDTEILIEAALAEPFDTVLDLGTGSGCILLTLLKEMPGAWGLGTDLSPKALEVAKQNRTALRLDGPAVLREGSWFDAVEGGPFDLIVSNPPYIAEGDMAGLAPEVRDWEPTMALTPGGDGLDAYRIISAGAQAHLVPGGRLMVEIGPDQGDAVAALFTAAGFENTRILPDLDGRDRVVVGNAP